jgi:hypothetical protein
VTALEQAILRAKCASQTPKMVVVPLPEPKKIDLKIKAGTDSDSRRIISELRAVNTRLRETIKRQADTIKRLKADPRLGFLLDEPRISDIAHAVAQYFDVSLEELKSLRRDHAVVVPRQIAMYLARKFTSHSFPSIGKAIGDRDHTTVLHAAAGIAQRRLVDEKLNHHVATIEAIFESKYDAVIPSPTPTASLDRAALPSFPQEGARSIIQDGDSHVS